MITVLGGSGAAVSAGALGGRRRSPRSLVYVLAFQRGGTSGYRLILVGIAIGALMLALIDYLLSRARIEDAQEATRWLLGSLNNRGWEDVVPLLVVLAVLAAGHRSRRAGRCARSSSATTPPTGSGVRVERARLGLVALAVALVSITTVAVGPIAFVALTAPQIARRLARTAAPTADLLGARRRGARARRRRRGAAPRARRRRCPSAS